MKLLKTLAIGVGVVVLLVLVAMRLRYGGGADFPSYTATPKFNETQLETVAELAYPPGNIAVAANGRTFFTFHPEARPEIKVAELVGDTAVPFPSRAWQSPETEALGFQNVLSVRIDQHNQLWVLDNANHGFGQPRLLAFNLSTGLLTHQFDFDASIAPKLSHLNDLQISADGRFIFIADASAFGLTPAIIVYDVENRKARRLLEDHVSVVAERFVPIVQGRRMQVFGVFAVRPGVDSIALSRDGQWLYFAAITAQKMYKAKVADLIDDSLTPEQLEQRVSVYAEKTASDGITTDNEGNIYLSDLVNSAVHRITPSGKLDTLMVSNKLRWPDGFSFGADGWLYVTCSALHQVLGRSDGAIADSGPYQIYRFKPGATATAGH